MPQTLVLCPYPHPLFRTGDLGEARAIFDQAVNYAFRGVDDLADVWCAYAEMEIRHKSVFRAREPRFPQDRRLLLPHHPTSQTDNTSAPWRS